jgi:hypothetical protein
MPVQSCNDSDNLDAEEIFHISHFLQKISRASLSICAQFRSDLLNEREANITGRSELSGITWDKTAPSPKGDASYANPSLKKMLLIAVTKSVQTD